MGRGCPAYSECFYYAARRRMARAQILVVNHALFFSDLALRRGGASLLPEHDIVIFDEAHMIEEVAGDHLGVGVSSAAVERVLAKLYSERGHRGLLVHYGLGDLQAVEAGAAAIDLAQLDALDPDERVVGLSIWSKLTEHPALAGKLPSAQARLEQAWSDYDLYESQLRHALEPWLTH
jgi:Rad3-related DNA helicase